MNQTQTSNGETRPSPERSFNLDGREIAWRPGDTILQAARRAGVYIPSLCAHPELKPHGSCKLCTVSIGGRLTASCTMPATDGLEVTSRSNELTKLRRQLLELLFVEGNHFCPSCEKSGGCELQALAYEHQMLSGRHAHFYPQRRVDASHPELLLDFNRCIYCELCVRASREKDGKDVFAISGRGREKILAVNSPSGLLKDSDIDKRDLAANICPVGVILHKRQGFATPIGERVFDQITPKSRVEAPGEMARPTSRIPATEHRE